jgi:Na+/proline symporter
MTIMLSMLAAFYLVVIGILYVSKRKDAKASFSEYAVGGRSYGPWFVAMSYVNSWWPGSTFIAFFGLAAGAGVFGLYGLAYSILGVGLMYFMATRAWRWGAKYNLQSQPDLLGKRFNSHAVRVISSIIGVVALLPWVVLGMQALGTLFQIASGGTWSIVASLIVGVAVIVVRQFWTVKMGMRGLILTDMFQGSVAYVLSAVIGVMMLTGLGNSPISFSALATLPEKFLLIPGDGDTYGPFYWFSLIFTGVVGALCWPTSFQRIFTANSVRSVKAATTRTMLISGGFYTILMLVGMAAVAIPAVAAAPQMAWFTLLDQYGGTWMAGLAVVIVFAAAMGHIDGSVQVCGLQIANDIVQRPGKRLSDRKLIFIAKGSMIAFMALATVLAFATFNMTRLQLLAQISYQLVVQIAVPLFLGIFWKHGNKYGAIAGMSAGAVLAAVLTAIYPDDIAGLGSLTSGVVALALNLVVYLVVSQITGQDAAERARIDEFFEAAKHPALRSDILAIEEAAAVVSAVDLDEEMTSK